MKKLTISAGHGANTAGKRCLKSIAPAETREWWLNQRVAGYLQEELARYAGVEVCRVDDVTGAVDVPISGGGSRMTAANQWGADFYLSIHHNAGIGGKNGGGISAFVYGETATNKPLVGAETLQWRDEIYRSLLAFGGLCGNRATPLAAANFAEVRETSMPAVLVECGFMDSATDTPIILTDAYARNLAKGLRRQSWRAGACCCAVT